MEFYWGDLSIARMDRVYPYLVECATLTLKNSKYDLTIPWMGGVRTAEQQNKLFQDGNSKCDGYNDLSYHQIWDGNKYGMAIDIIPVGKDPYKDTRKLNYIGNLMLINWQELIAKYMKEEGKDIGVMRWGGTFGSTSWDRPHFEIRL